MASLMVNFIRQFDWAMGAQIPVKHFCVLLRVSVNGINTWIDRLSKGD